MRRLIGVLTCALCVVAHGQVVRPLDLRTALQRAARAHPLLRSASYAIPIARADSISASLFPNPALSVQYAQIPSQLPKPSGLGPVFGQWQASLMQTVDLAGQRQRRISVAEQALQTAGESYRATLQQVLADVALRWIELWSAERRQTILARAVASADSLVTINRIRLRSQAIAPADVWRAEILASQYRLQQLQAEQQVRSAVRALQFALSTSDTLTTGLQEPAVPVEDQPLHEWIERALAHRADYQLAKASLRVAEANVALQDALGVPNPDLGLVGMQQQGTAFLGVGINYPLPLLNRNEGERQKARLSREQARTDLERLERQISAEVSIAFESYRTAQQALAQARTVLTKASDVLATVQLAYLKGATPIVDLLEAQRSWYETEQSYYDALAEYWRSVVGLLAASGQLSNLVEE
jgi:cobalt-zinc-cadmium efflux system outer membrane protein